MYTGIVLGASMLDKWYVSLTIALYFGSSSDFLSNLLVLLLRTWNAGIDNGGLLTDLSEAAADSLRGVCHSTAYLDKSVYTYVN